MNKIVAPSILSADFANLGVDVKRVVEHGAQWVHIDVMDGHFVDNITLGAPIVKSLRTFMGTDAFFDCHLMVENPEKWIDDFTEAGATQITFHIEAMKRLSAAERLCKAIRDNGMKASVAVKPNTSIDAVISLLDDGLVDNVLIMTVEPGFGGQAFMENQMSKVRQIRRKYPTLNIQVDGGLNAETTKIAAANGANVVVAGSAIFGSVDVAKALDDIQSSLTNSYNQTP
eukprot:Gregarina_sp_Poly_1__10690@NODE_80_length_15637_cov_125_963134_g68_i0_p10_GENE_NODE_80_length_15637_cov_125_963134_g68_i0NODE_80_length_15637_cov_125_963134_g68_i0_p10_ORF_typecomplete_len229_score43_77Ribul_P_3_epim/PF00834_19/1_9e81His_biosynth/PF00977_21/7_8His_biosynth/PF00977_21/0_017QRPTase_C/PF01729_19/3_2e02QRPTase_C/PF01729_19/0_0029BKACE/PF05853_12/0_001Trp_syntA/PF00290_20/0_0062Ala_racemase_N/PF01168_20/0_074ThiG/PF05690_14/8_1e03ThiG/PF05690_14/0_025Aldolase/PF01081_19/4_6e03Aldolas